MPSVIPGYCNNQPGCVETTSSLRIVNGSSMEPWDRGSGNVTISYTEGATSTLDLPRWWEREGTGDQQILYYQGECHLQRECPLAPPTTHHPPPRGICHPPVDHKGPIMNRALLGGDYDVHATFTSEIHSKNSDYTTNQMVRG